MLPDNYDLWKAHEWKQAQELKKLPECCMCGNPIQDEVYFEDDGEKFCEDCWHDHVRDVYMKFVEV